MKIDDALNLAAERRGGGNPAEAESIYRQILSQQPAHSPTRLALGVLLHERGRFADAVKVYRLGLALDPSQAEMWNNLGNTLGDMGGLAQAAAACRQALAVDPRLFSAHTNLANALGRGGDLHGAARHYREAIAINPEFADAHNNLGTTLHGMGDMDGAEASLRRALELSPDYAEAHSNLGSVLGEKEMWREAAAELTEAVRLRPDYAAAHWNLGLVLLMLGDLERGWAEYDWRRRVSGLIVPLLQFARPPWEGEALNGRRVLVHAEQGFGDAIHFVRYAAMVAGRGGVPVVYCPPVLAGLLRGAEGVEQVVGFGETLPEFDLHCPLLSLPNIFKTTLANIPADVPYIRADEALVRQWAGRLNGDGRKKVGLVWAGGIKPPGRSLPLAALAPLGGIPGVKFYSLQKDEAAGELADAPPGLRMDDWSGDLTDFSQTAALIANLDLVITIDTAVAHLAGAMGKPTWVLLKHVPDFRWMLGRTDSPWYPTMRLFRQTRAGDWETPVELAFGALQSMS